MVEVTRDPHKALRRLRSAAADGRLGLLAERFDLRILVVFGSSLASESSPKDLDLAYLATGRVDQLELLSALYEVTGYDGADLVDLDRAGIVLRAEALCGDLLYERARGSFAEMQTNAVVQRMDTAWMRRLSLEAMAS